ncbi:PEP-CTERM sorting domain-containing protein [Undibacterium sp.]|jgi:hypothetical protein|uniref:PEP-CTERM sorting domain-containing protein n=1 Tax=Undibacterium sp. TaxID=1914977 RepID=UPI002C524465|nr:PEP-CTERM sorting domain-containing protein [Undibacterium sp.]HTD02770.1 PEP-CTERM sorting domain-containing protein [Undibacterium sp.]
MKTKYLALSILSALTVLPAWANVVYTWHTLVPSTSIASFASQIVVSDAAYSSGSASVNFSCFMGPCPAGSNDGVLSISYSANGENIVLENPASAVPQFGVRIDQIAFDFTNVGFLRGNLFFNTGSDDITISSAGNVWTINALNSDNEGSACFRTAHCGDITGYYETDFFSVPEPMPLPLMSLGLISLLGLRRLKRG